MTDEIPTVFLRLFIAIAVPLEVRKEIKLAQGQLRRHAPLAGFTVSNPDR